MEAVFSLQWVEGKLKQSLVVYRSGGNKYRGFERLRWPESFWGAGGKRERQGERGRERGRKTDSEICRGPLSLCLNTDLCMRERKLPRQGKEPLKNKQK